jgi:hypothetical protein
MIFLCTYSSRHPAVVAIRKDVKIVARDYLKAIEMSVKMAERTFTFASEVIPLCQHLTHDPSTNKHKFINKTRRMARQAYHDVKDTRNKFSAIQRTLLMV